jgi:hypothetical protein
MAEMDAQGQDKSNSSKAVWMILTVGAAIGMTMTFLLDDAPQDIGRAVLGLLAVAAGMGTAFGLMLKLQWHMMLAALAGVAMLTAVLYCGLWLDRLMH